ncbi:MAG: redoxin domain-containing protein [Sedimentisphaerales bacterium]|nr:redoxin domain-containing protein [Sedimentisphaerales bacterium]
MRRKEIALTFLGLLLFFTNRSSASPLKEITCKGKVLDSQRRPVAGAKVAAYEMFSKDGVGNVFLRPLGDTVTTGSDGGFIFKTESESFLKYFFSSSDKLMYGYIVAVKDGYSLGWSAWDMSEDVEAEIELGWPQCLEGTIVDEAGKLVASAEVRAVLYRKTESVGFINDTEWLPGIGPLESLAAKTDSEGRFEFNNIPEDSSVDLFIRAEGKAAITTYQSELGPSFKAGQTNVRVVLPDEGCIEGRIIDTGKNEGIAGVEITAMPRISSVGAITVPRFSAAFYQPFVCVSEDDGSFAIGGFPEGQYCLRGNFPFHDNIGVESGKTSDFIIECSDVVHGHVTGPDGKQVVDAEVQIRQYQDLKAGGSWRIRTGNVRTDKSGRYIHTDIGGPYTVGAIYREKVPSEEGYRFQYIRWNEAFNGSRQVDFQFNSFPEGTANLSGRVADQNSEAIENFAVSIQTKVDWNDYSGGYLFNHGCFRLFDKADGKYEIGDLPAGTYHVSIYNPYDSKRYNFPRLDELVLEKGKTATVTCNVIKKDVYYGRILFEDGSAVFVDSPPWQGAKSHVSVPSEYGSSSVSIDKDGYFEVFFTNEELEKARDGESEMRIYYPSFTEELVSYTLGTFPLELLSKDKKEAGVVKLPKPTYTPSINLKNAPSLKQKLLPGFDGITINVDAAHYKDRIMLVCFFDMQQRPSRNCILQLSKRAQELETQDIAVIAIQASKIEKRTLDDWVKENKISYPIGMIESASEKTRFAWGVKSLPWLILADKRHIIISEGFAVSELDSRIMN